MFHLPINDGQYDIRSPPASVCRLLGIDRAFREESKLCGEHVVAGLEIGIQMHIMSPRLPPLGQPVTCVYSAADGMI